MNIVQGPFPYHWKLSVYVVKILPLNIPIIYLDDKYGGSKDQLIKSGQELILQFLEADHENLCTLGKFS